MFVPAATAWRTASEPEWKKVPSPRFWKMCGVSVKGAIPTQWRASPPMWVSPIVRRSMRSAMPWQPMAARALGLVVEDVADEELAEGPLLLDDEQLLQAARELPDDRGLHREEHPDLEEPDAVVPERRVVQAELAERLAQVVVGLARRGDPEPRVRRVDRDAVEPVDARERLGGLEPPVLDLALGVEPPRRHEERVLPLLPPAPVVLEAGVGDDHAIGRDLG